MSRAWSRRAGLAVAVALVTPGFVSTGAHAAAHDIAYLTAPFYIVFEGSDASFGIERCCHGVGNASVDYAVEADTASPGQDLTEISGTVDFAQGIGSEDIDVHIVDDSAEEPLETAEVTLTGASGGPLLSSPKTSTMTIIDDDGPARIGWSAATYTTFESRQSVTVTVTRAGDSSAAASVSYSTSPDTASEKDFTAATGTIELSAGQRFKSFDIDLTDDKLSEDEESFGLDLSAPTGAELAENPSGSVSILDDDSGGFDFAEPITQFHLPLDGNTYARNKLTQIHVFSDDEDSGIKHIDMAIRQKRKNDTCKWFDGKEFTKHSCKDKQWVRLKGLDFVIYELPIKLPRSKGKDTEVRFYTGYARGIDAAGNIEDGFERGRNESRFEVK